MKSPNTVMNGIDKKNIDVKNLVLKRGSKSSNQKDVTILKGINLTFKPGTLNAIMAPNGHGKSTFLNALFGKVDSDVMISGDIHYKGKEREIETWFEDASYVEQGDYDLKDQTVREALEFSARIRGRDIDCEEYKNDFDEIVKALDLKKILDKRSDSISGGEKKRTMIAIELLANKKVLILDEPTADLDSFLASKLLEFLNKRAKERGLIIVSSIHQPSDDLIQIFDNILLLNEGRQIYYGDQKNLLPYLRSKGLIKKEKTSTSDFLFNLMYDKGEGGNFGGFENEIINESNGIVQSSNPVKVSRKYNFNFNFSMMKFKILLKRFYQIAFKKKGFYIQVAIAFILPFVSKFLTKVVHNASMELVRLNYNYDSQLLQIETLKQENTSRQFFETLGCFFFSLMLNFMSLGSFLDLEKQTKIELSKSYYSPFTLFLSIFSSEFLFSLLLSVCFALSLYFYRPESYLTFSCYSWLFIFTFLNTIYNFAMTFFSRYFESLKFLSHLINTLKTVLPYFAGILNDSILSSFILRHDYIKNLVKGIYLVLCVALCPLRFYRSLFAFCKLKFQKNILKNAFSDLIALFSFKSSPNISNQRSTDISYSDFNLIGSDFLLGMPPAKTASELTSEDRKAFFVTLQNVDYRWNYVGLIGSLMSCVLISYLLFTIMYSPSLSVKESNKNDKSEGKNIKLRKSISLWKSTKYCLYAVSILAFVLITYYGFSKKRNSVQNSLVNE